jgi:hypothetical protein
MSSCGIIGCIGGLLLCIISLLAWQMAHPFTYCHTNSRHPGHQYCFSSILCISSMPGCATVGESWFNFTRSCCNLVSSGTTRAIPLWYLPALSWRRLHLSVHLFRTMACYCCRTAMIWSSPVVSMALMNRDSGSATTPSLSSEPLL